MAKAKKKSISSLVRAAAKSEAEFKEVIQPILDENDHEFTARFFDRMNIPGRRRPRPTRNR